MKRLGLFMAFCLMGGLLMACLDDSEEVKARLGERTQLKMGKYLTLEGARFKFGFAKVEEDSRCPKGASCIWAGQARITLVSSTGSTAELVLPGSQTEVEATATLDGHTIHCFGLNPYPVAGEAVVAEGYSLDLEIRAAP